MGYPFCNYLLSNIHRYTYNNCNKEPISDNICRTMSNFYPSVKRINCQQKTGRIIMNSKRSVDVVILCIHNQLKVCDSHSVKMTQSIKLHIRQVFLYLNNQLSRETDALSIYLWWYTLILFSVDFVHFTSLVNVRLIFRTPCPWKLSRVSYYNANDINWKTF